MDNFVYAGLVLSLALNAYLAYRFIRKEHVLTKDAQALLSELTRGKAVLRVEVLDPTGLFYRSPRG